MERIPAFLGAVDKPALSWSYGWSRKLFRVGNAVGISRVKQTGGEFVRRREPSAKEHRVTSHQNVTGCLGTRNDGIRL